MESLPTLNYIRQNYQTIIEVNPNATFQKKKKPETKMIRRNGKTELFETEAYKTPINLQTEAQTRVLPIQVPIQNIPIQTRVQTPRTNIAPNVTTRNYTYEDLIAKGMLKPALQEILMARGLPKSGNKDVLIQRILNSQI